MLVKKSKIQNPKSKIQAFADQWHHPITVVSLFFIYAVGSDSTFSKIFPTFMEKKSQ